MERVFHDRQWLLILFSLEENFWCYDMKRESAKDTFSYDFTTLSNYYSSKSLIFSCECVKCECQNVDSCFSCCLVPLFQNLHGDTEHVWCRGSSRNFPVHCLCWCIGQLCHALKRLHVWMWFGQHLQDCCTGIRYTVHQYLHSISWRADVCKVYVYTFVVYN